MMNLLAILILIVGGLNWASIGFLQYDFIAGFFGTQASIFSRLIYICIGIATLYFIFMTFKYKGNIKIYDRKKSHKNDGYIYNQPPNTTTTHANINHNTVPPNYSNTPTTNNHKDILS